jgi:hypothetical protein
MSSSDIIISLIEFVMNGTLPMGFGWCRFGLFFDPCSLNKSYTGLKSRYEQQTFRCALPKFMIFLENTCIFYSFTFH